MNGSVMKTHHLQFTQIQHSGANRRRLVIKYILFEHLYQVESIDAFAVLKIELTKRLDCRLIICSQFVPHSVLAVFTPCPKYTIVH